MIQSHLPTTKIKQKSQVKPFEQQPFPYWGRQDEKPTEHIFLAYTNPKIQFVLSQALTSKPAC